MWRAGPKPCSRRAESVDQGLTRADQGVDERTETSYWPVPVGHWCQMRTT